MNEKRFNCHVKFSKLPNGFMVLDYTKKGKEQTVIEDISREKAHRVMDRLNELSDENEHLQQELFESEVDYFKENYHDNPIRADDHILELKKEFKERFGRDFEYGEK